MHKLEHRIEQYLYTSITGWFAACHCCALRLFIIKRRYIAFHEIYFQSSAGKNEAMGAQEVQISLSHTDTHIHSVTSWLRACLYYIEVAMGYIHHVRQDWKKALYLLLSSHTQTHPHTHKHSQRHTHTLTLAETHTEGNQSSRDNAVNISVNTSNCLPARKLANVNPAWQSLLCGAWLRAWCFYLQSGMCCTCQHYISAALYLSCSW